MPRDKLLTIKEVAAYLRLNRFTVYRMAERGELPGAKIALRWRFQEGEIVKWLRRQGARWRKGDHGRHR
jgi:excisionase family DNA binding protein